MRKEMDAKLKEIEEKYKREKEESDLLFEQHRKVRAPQGHCNQHCSLHNRAFTATVYERTLTAMS